MRRIHLHLRPIRFSNQAESREPSKKLRARGPCPRKIKDERFKKQISEIHQRSRGTYWSPRILAELKFLGERTSKKRVQRLMKEQGVFGASRRRWVTTTARDHSRPAPDFVKGSFVAQRPNRLWVADITYIPTWEGFLFLSVVLDV